MKLFISYAHDDNNLCESFVDQIADKHDIWSDHRLPIGFDWEQMLDEKLEWCDAVIFLITPNALQSNYCRYEINKASDLGKMIFPVILVKADYPTALDKIQYVDMSESIKDKMPKLLAAIKEAEEASVTGVPHSTVRFDEVFETIEAIDNIDNRPEQQEEVDAPPQEAEDTKTSTSIFSDVPREVILGVIVAIIMGGLGFIGNTLFNRCTTLVPVIGTQLRDQTCPEPQLLPFQDFVVVSSKLVVDSSSNQRTAAAISQGIENELGRAEIPPALGALNVVDSNNIWIDQASTLSQLRDAARQYADRFNADVVVYGAVSEAQSPIFEPAFYLPQQASADLLELIEALDPEALDLRIPIRDGQSDTLTSLLQGMRGFVLGLQLLNPVDESEDVDLSDRINRLELALEAFRTVPETTDDDFYAVSNLYAGNAALQLAILKQMDYEQQNNCIAGRCSEYTSEIIGGYLDAWDHYAIAVASDRDDLSIRGLIGRGNVHYRLARIDRLASEADSFFVDNYVCATGSSLYQLTEFGEQVSDVNWAQRGLIAERCYQQVVIRAESDSIIQIKGIFGAAQSLEWVGRETRDDTFSETSFDLYTSIITRYEETSADDALLCFAGFSYGQRAQIRWDSPDDTLNDISNIRDDLRSAIDLLENAPSNCDADSALTQYQNDLSSLGG